MIFLVVTTRNNLELYKYVKKVCLFVFLQLGANCEAFPNNNKTLTNCTFEDK